MFDISLRFVGKEIYWIGHPLDDVVDPDMLLVNGGFPDVRTALKDAHRSIPREKTACVYMERRRKPS